MTPRKMLVLFVVFEAEVQLFSWEKSSVKRDAPSWTTFWNFGSIGFVWSSSEICNASRCDSREMHLGPLTEGCQLKTLKDGELTPCNGTMQGTPDLKVLVLYIRSK